LKIKVLTIGKTKASYLQEGEEEYKKRLSFYTTLEWIILPDVSSKGMSHELIKEKEAPLFLKHIKAEDKVWLLDERGKTFTSMEFSQQIQKNMNAGTKTLILIIGGAFGFHSSLYDRADAKVSLSALTFSHEMVRLFLLEQLYRAHTILKGESYHHE
jgi:23S rRNA (pseudouridine1915-N3)-methyltransferase